jgi:hypothetical protein
MKEKIYTIPVNEAYRAGGHCPLCTLEATLNDSLLDYYLGPSLMEPDVRKSTNAKGFCRRHLSELYNRANNRLGLALMLHTHTSDLISDLNPPLTDCAPRGKKKLLSKGQQDFRQNLNNMAGRIEQRVSSCAICERLASTMDRYLDVIFYQYFSEPEFKVLFGEGGGYCLPHVALLLRGAAKYLNQEEAGEFVACLARIQNSSLETLRDDVEWFTLKFDHRNIHKDWKNSKDAIPRVIRKIGGDSDLKG